MINRRSLTLACLALAPLAALAVPNAHATTATWWQKDGASWTQTYIPESGGVKLHADVLRPANLTPGAKTPVILSIGPYFNHTGQLGPVWMTTNGPETPFSANKLFIRSVIDGLHRSRGWSPLSSRSNGRPKSLI